MAAVSLWVMLVTQTHVSARDDGVWQKVLVAAKGDRIGGKTVNLVQYFSLNERGAVAFLVWFQEGGSGVARWDGTAAQLIAASGQTIDGNRLRGVYCTPALNSHGEIAFVGDFLSPRGEVFSAIVRSTADGELAFLVRTGQPVLGQPLWRLGCPALNDQGEVAYCGWFGRSSGLFTSEQGLVVQPGDAIAGLTITGVDEYVSLNNQGEVAFLGQYKDATSRWGQSSGLSTQARALVVPGQGLREVTVTGVGRPALNTLGEVAFQGTYRPGAWTGILTSTRGVVATNGPTIAGLILNGIGPVAALNDGGEVAFPLRLQDGRQAIALARYVPPAPFCPAGVPGTAVLQARVVQEPLADSLEEPEEVLADRSEVLERNRRKAEIEEISLGKYWQWFKEAWYEVHIDERVKRAEKILDATESETTTYLWMLGDELGITSITEALGGWGVDEERALTGTERAKRGAYGLVISLLNYVGLRGAPAPKGQLGRSSGVLDDVVRTGADDVVRTAGDDAARAISKSDELVLSSADEAASHAERIADLQKGVKAVAKRRGLKQSEFFDSAELGVLREGNTITIVSHGSNLRTNPAAIKQVRDLLREFVRQGGEYAEFLGCNTERFIDEIIEYFPELMMKGYADAIKILAKGQEGLPIIAEGEAAERLAAEILIWIP
jgi:hypothetical protein